MASRIAGRAFDGPRITQGVGVSGLSRTVLPTDLRRLCGKSKVENVAHVALDYKRFKPTGTATIVFTRPEFIRAGLQTLEQAVLGGKLLKAFPINSFPDPARTRGSQGILEAAQRGVLNGDGPDAGISGGSKTVVIYGLPSKTTPLSVSESLRSFKVAGMEQGKPIVVKLSPTVASYTSRFVVRLVSVSEAYRLVRALHMQKWRPESFRDQYTVRVAVVS